MSETKKRPKGPVKRRTGRIRLSLLQKILLLMVITLAIPSVWFEIYSMHMVREMMEKQAVIEEANSVALAADSIDNTARSLVLYTLGIYQDPDTRRISDKMAGRLLDSQELRRLNLEFIERADSVMQVDRVYKMDIKTYAMLTCRSQALLNFSSLDQDKVELLRELSERKPESPFQISWTGLIKNYDMYRFRNEDYLIILGKQMDEEQEDSPVLWIGVMENSIKKQLFPNPLSSEEKRFLVDENMRILSSGESAYIGKDIREIINMEMPEEKEMQQVNVDTVFGKAVAAFSRLENCPWMLVGIKPYSQILDEITEINHKRLLSTLSYIAVFGLIAVFVIRRMTDPLKNLSIQMMRFRPGIKPYENQIPLTGGKEVYGIYECYYSMTKNIYELMKENERVQKEKSKIEMQLLQAQIKPHFLFNTLMSIRCAIGNGNTEKAADMTLALSLFLRNTIAKGGEMIPLKDELEIITTYIRIQNDRSYQKVFFRAEIESGLESFEIPKLLLQPLVENSISHGFRQQEGGEILVSAQKAEDRVVIIVKDNGKGYEEDPLAYCEGGQHFGVYSVQHRLKIYYGEKGSLSYRLSGGTIAEIVIPFQNARLEKGGGEDVENSDSR